MADRNISDLTALTTPASGDYLPIVDISEAAAVSKNKRITIEELFRGVPTGSAAAPSIAIEGDEDTGIYSPGANQLAISTNSAGRLFIDSSGNVGVGASPGSAFHVRTSAGYNAYFQTSGSQLRINYLNDAASANISAAYRATDFAWQKGDGNEVARIDSSGRLGVGTSSPGKPLDVRVAGDANVASFSNGSRGIDVAATSTGALIGAYNTDNDIQIKTYGSANNSIILSTSNAERLRVDPSGRVGIGTTSPGAPLTVVAQSNAQAINIRGRSSDNIGELNIFSNDEATNYAKLSARSTYVELRGPSSGEIRFNKSDGTQFATIDSSGRLLVGTTTTSAGLAALFQGGGANRNDPGTILLARGDSNVLNDYELGLINFSDSNHGVAARIGAYRDGGTWNTSTSRPTRLVFSTTADGASSPTERMRITSTGQVRLAGAGITFNGDTATANELDDYEEGTFTPTLNTSGGTSVTLSTAIGYYRKIGSVVYAWGSITASTNLAETLYYQLGGQPFTYVAALQGVHIGTADSSTNAGNLSHKSVFSIRGVGAFNTVRVFVSTDYDFQNEDSFSFVYKAYV